jgi:hypothetical protein
MTKTCEDCEKVEGIWMVYIRKKFQGIYGEKDGPFCDECLVLAITGYHTGGGLTSEAIEKIERMENT